MLSKQLSTISSLMLCGSGAAYLLDTGLDALAPSISPGLGALVPILGLAGFPGLWLSLGLRTPAANLTYILNMLALTGLVVVTFLNNRLFPELSAQQIRSLIVQIKPELMLIGVTYMVAALLLLWICRQERRLTRAGAMLYGIGAIPVSLPPLMPDWLVALGGLFVGTGLIVLGLALFDGRSQSRSDAETSDSALT